MTADAVLVIHHLPNRLLISQSNFLQAQAGRCYGVKFTGTRYDTGTPLGLLTTSIAFALKRPDMAPELREYMRKALSEQ